MSRRHEMLLVAALVTPVALHGCGHRSSDPPPWFEETAERAGLRFTHVSGHESRRLFPEIMGGGAALFDMDGDGDLDVYIVQSGSLRRPNDESAANRLFRNDGGARFTDVSGESGAADRGYGMGVAAGDYDNDGDVDLYVTNFGPNVLLRNDGAGRFEDITSAAAVGDPAWGTSAAFVDIDADGDLDLFIANYVNWSEQAEQDCYSDAGVADYCDPTNYNAPATDTLYRNEGDGTFTDITADSGLLAAFGNGLGVVCSDFDGDGQVDIFVANDLMLNQLWLNRGAEGFVDEALLRGCALDEHGRVKSGMGVAADDVDGDADEEILVVNMEGQTDSFFLNRGGLFSDHTGLAGLAAVSRGFTRFGVGLFDADNDGSLDLYIANGRVTLTGEPASADPYAEENLLFRGTAAGRFEEVLPRGGTATPLIGTSRAAAFGDVDGDGGMDIVVVNRDGPVHLLRNVVARRGQWIRFKVLERSGRDALGARLVVRVGGREVTRVVRAAYSYCASSDPAVHLGLGDVRSVEHARVHWVDGAVDEFGDFDAGQVVELRRTTGDR